MTSSSNRNAAESRSGFSSIDTYGVITMRFPLMKCLSSLSRSESTTNRSGRNRFRTVICLAFAALTASLTVTGTAESSDHIAAVRSALTFHATFDHGVDAAFGSGDLRLYTAPTLNDRKTGHPGLPDSGAVTIEKGAGRFGDALKFHRTGSDVVYYQVLENLNYSNSGWNGTISYWLKLNPDTDLPPGYCDPLFITPRVFNDGALWTDFSDKPPRAFRHGAVPDRKIWDPKMEDFDKIPESKRPLATVKHPPFSSDQWTHIVLAFSNFNTGRPDGVSTMYLNGVPAATVPTQTQTYTWDPAESTAVLGISYVGLLDELSFYNKTLNEDEVKALYESAKSLSEKPVD